VTGGWPGRSRVSSKRAPWGNKEISAKRSQSYGHIPREQEGVSDGPRKCSIERPQQWGDIEYPQSFSNKHPPSPGNSTRSTGQHKVNGNLPASSLSSTARTRNKSQLLSWERRDRSVTSSRCPAWAEGEGETSILCHLWSFNDHINILISEFRLKATKKDLAIQEFSRVGGITSMFTGGWQCLTVINWIFQNS
jgi:hypothetical protein